MNENDIFNLLSEIGESCELFGSNEVDSFTNISFSSRYERDLQMLSVVRTFLYLVLGSIFRNVTTVNMWLSNVFL